MGLCWLKKQFSFLVDIAGKRNHGEEKEEPNKQFQVYTYYTYRVSVIQNYSHLLVNLKLQYPHHPGNLWAFVCCPWQGGIWILPGWGWEFKPLEYTRNFKVRHPLAWVHGTKIVHIVNWPPLKLYFYRIYPESIFCTDILITFVTEKKLLFKSSVIQSQYAAEAEDCDRDTTGWVIHRYSVCCFFIIDFHLINIIIIIH